MSKEIKCVHGVVCSMPGERFGYFGWPTVALMDDGSLVVASSGLRSAHIGPFGKTVLNTSSDGGVTWSEPRVIQNSMIDDRDAGVVNLGGGKMLVSWFRGDTRKHADNEKYPESDRKIWKELFRDWSDEQVKELLGSWVMLSDDSGATWSEPIRAPVSAPHGPVLLKNGELLYLGKIFREKNDLRNAVIACARSSDGGRSWEITGEVPLYPGTVSRNYHEPHVVELPSGKLVGMIRVQSFDNFDLKASGIISFSMMQTESSDSGRTWTVPKPLGFEGSPPHLLRHSSGMLILSYGYRRPPFGERVALSKDDGATWDHDWIIRGDGPDGDKPGDLGYPSTIELPGGELFTVYYQKLNNGEKCSLLWSRWSLP